MSGTPHTHWSNFIHDLVTVDFSNTDVYTGVRLGTLLVLLIVVGVVTNHIAELSLVTLGAAFVLAIDEVRSKGTRTRTLLTASLVYASIFFIGMIISMIDYLVIPILAVGLFMISYFTVYPRTLVILTFASIVSVIAITTHSPTLTVAAQGFMFFFAGGLWAIVGGLIFPSRKNLTKRGSVTGDSAQKRQHQYLIWKEKVRPLVSNLTLHSQHFQYATVLAITAAIGLLIAHWFELPEGDWIVITIVVILLPSYSDIAFTFDKIVHKIIGTIIGAVIAIIIIHSIENTWLLSILLFIFASTYLSTIKVKNYAFTVIFMTVMILLLIDISNPATGLTTPLERVQNVFIGCALSLLASVLWIVTSSRKSSSCIKE